MPQNEMLTQMSGKPGFIAALDQSGGSTPGALRAYGVPDGAYAGDDAMYALVHAMRARIISAPPFTGNKVIGVILFERTMDGGVGGKKVPAFLWEDRRIVPFLKVDNGLAPEADGVSLMKPMPTLDALLERATRSGIFGTKMRSVIARASPSGVEAVVAQQFAVAEQIAAHGLVPIIEPEVSIVSPDKEAAERLLVAALTRALDALPDGRKVMLKVTLPETPDLYAPLIAHRAVARVVALSGGYTNAVACAKLAKNHGVIASFSRALVEGLKISMSDAEFDAALGAAIDEIFRASTIKT